MSITVRIELDTPSTTDQTIALRLYIHDSRLACGPPAALSASCEVQLPKDESSIEITMDPDMTVKHAGKSWGKMIEPSMYVALDVEKGSVTYIDGPVFRIQPGGNVAVLKVKAK
jgi:hypothetical protein